MLFFTGHEEDKAFKYISKIKDECSLLLSINAVCKNDVSTIRDGVEILSSLSEYLLTLVFCLQVSFQLWNAVNPSWSLVMCLLIICFVVLQMKTNEFGLGVVGEIPDDQVKIYWQHMWQLKPLIRFVKGIFSNILSTYSFYLQCYVLNSTGPSTALY